MQHSTRLPRRFPMGTRYVLEACGPVVRRYVQFPDGRRLELQARKAQSGKCVALQTSLVPDHIAETIPAR